MCDVFVLRSGVYGNNGSGDKNVQHRQSRDLLSSHMSLRQVYDVELSTLTVWPLCRRRCFFWEIVNTHKRFHGKIPFVKIKQTHVLLQHA